MSNSVVDTLVTRYTLDAGQYVAGSARVVAATRAQASGFAALGQRARTGAQAVGRFADFAADGFRALSRIGLVAAGVATVAGVTGAALVREAANFEALIKSLEAVEGSADGAKKRLEELRQLAKKPGIGFEESIQGYVQLRRSDMDPDFAKRLLSALANQVALSGGGQAEFARVARAAMQIAVAPFLQGDELRQLSEAGIPAYGIVNKAFGTASTDELRRQGITSAQVLQKLVVEMEKMPQAGDSMKNVLENLGVAFKMLTVQGGQSLGGALMPLVDSLTKAAELGAEAGIGKAAMDGFLDSLGLLQFELKDSRHLIVSVAAAFMTVGGAVRNLKENLAALMEHPIMLGGGLFGKELKNMLKGEGDPNGMSLSSEYLRNLQTIEMMMDLAEMRRATARGGEATDPVTVEAVRQTEHLAAIEANTAMLVDFQRNILGGSDIGRMGITPIELGKVKRGGDSPKDLVNQAAELFYRAAVASGAAAYSNARRMRA